MSKQNEMEEVKKLIKSGFDLDLISFELDIPLTQVRKCKIELEYSETNSLDRTACSAKHTIDERNKQAHSKIEQMREKYRQLYFGSTKVEVSSQKKLSQDEIKLINATIIKIRDYIQKMKNISRFERRKFVSDILLELKKIEEYQLPMEQAKQLYILLCSVQPKGLNLGESDRTDYYINKQREKYGNQFAKAFSIEQRSVEDLDKLQELAKKATEGLEKGNPIIGAIYSIISNRKAAIRQKQTISRIKNDIPQSIDSIIKELASGAIDIQRANEIIDKEARRKVESRPKTKFSLTEEQERNQILIQIRHAIAEKPERYPLQKPEKVILQIQELCGGSLVVSIGAVVKNLIGRKKFEIAKSICDEFSKKDKDKEQESEYIKYIKNLRIEIKNAEISDAVMNVINMKGTVKEERICFEAIEQWLKRGDVKPITISLGKNRDGTKNINLADIWTNDVQKER